MRGCVDMDMDTQTMDHRRRMAGGKKLSAETRRKTSAASSPRSPGPCALLQLPTTELTSRCCTFRCALSALSRARVASGKQRVFFFLHGINASHIDTV